MKVERLVLIVAWPLLPLAVIYERFAMKKSFKQCKALYLDLWGAWKRDWKNAGTKP